MDDIAIKVEGVSKRFLLPHEKKTSVKSLFTSLFGNKTTYSKQQALSDINFEIKKGEFFGIVGRNGSGKSTLLKIIAGIYQPTEGSVKTQGKLVPFIELGVGFNPELTGRENVFLNGAILGFTRKQIQKNYKTIVDFAELEDFMDQKLKNYSSGMQVRLAFACATMAEADILLVDEVLAVGDADFQRKCFRYFKELKKLKKTVIFVTHDMGAVREYCDRAILINESELRVSGNAEEVAQEYSKLFMSSDEKERVLETKRWGNGVANYSNITAKQKDENILIEASIHTNAELEKIIYGIHVFSLDGAEITATNNRLLLMPDINNTPKGATIKLSWSILNIFNDGEYFVTLTLVDDVGDVFDWVNEAATFSVKRRDRSTTFIVPPMKSNFEIVTLDKRKGR